MWLKINANWNWNWKSPVISIICSRCILETGKWWQAHCSPICWYLVSTNYQPIGEYMRVGFVWPYTRNYIIDRPLLSIFQHGGAEINCRHPHRGLRGSVLAHHDSVLVQPHAGHRACRQVQGCPVSPSSGLTAIVFNFSVTAVSQRKFVELEFYWCYMVWKRYVDSLI